MRAAVVPDWLAEVVRPKRAPVPWPAMIRAVLAICVPLAMALGRTTLGVLPAMGGILGTMADTGGPYLSRAPGGRPPGLALRGLAGRLLDEFGSGRLGRIFTLRLMTCMGVAGLMSEVLPLQRSYWVPLTVAIVLKPDYGSVFARALQRGIGTVVGAVAGAVLLVLVHGAWLLIPFGVLAALLPYGRSRNYGLLATFLTPLVVVLIDLLNPVG
jgi:uncharacterized membrane protein YccC